MILKPLFRKHFLLTFAVSVVMVWMCAFVARYVERFERDHFFNTQAEEIMAQIEAYQGDKRQYVNQLNELNEKMHSPLRIELKDGVPVLTMRPSPGGHGSHGPRWLGMPLGPFFATILAVLIASALSVVLIYRSFRDKAELAKDVLSKMQQGDLKVRFPISKWDEAAQIFKLYNEMADEIERLVSRLMENEKTRVGLLQELAHDLRTPVSSLRNVIETIHFEEEKLDQETKVELKEVALHETEYLSRLVEDLLFLALVLEPKYKTGSEEVSIHDLLTNQMSATAAAYPKIEYELETTGVTPKHILGNTHLLRRLLRNAFENAFSFARSKVSITLMANLGTLTMVIRDDGPGLSEAQLEMWGKKKATRYQAQAKDGRLSVGLGSVIIQTIASAHGGHASIRNVLESGRIVGAELTIAVRSSVRVAG